MHRHRLRGSPFIIVLLFHFACLLWSHTSGLCPVRCTCDDDTLRVHCTSANLDVVPITLNPELKELYLGDNEIKSIKASITVYHELEYLDMSHNQLVILDGKTFQHQSKLKYLLLQRNMISSLQNDSFIGLGALELLHLNENFLDEVPAGVFWSLSHLKKLDLSQNRISNVADDAFVGLTSLQTLLLRDNKLTLIPKQAFQKVSTLLNLDLGLNSFQVILENSFSYLNSLKELSLDGCGIHTIEPGAFKWLNVLLKLRVDDNELTEIPSRALFDVIRLEEIYIGQNKFSILRAMSFQRQRFLNTVDISGVRSLEKIEQRAFAENGNLENVVLNHNTKLRVIELGTFEGLPNLRRVSLRGDAFETFDYELLPWDELVYLDVRDNPLVCNCSIIWLWKLLRTKNFSNADIDDAEVGPSDITRVVCVNPQGLIGQLFVDLSADDLECYDVKTRRHIMIGVVAGSVALVTVIVTLAVRYRDRIAGVLKNKWNCGRKEPQYQKTNGEEDSTILQAAQQSLKMTPVTEL